VRGNEVNGGGGNGGSALGKLAPAREGSRGGRMGLWKGLYGRPVGSRIASRISEKHAMHAARLARVPPKRTAKEEGRPDEGGPHGSGWRDGEAVAWVPVVGAVVRRTRG
jgi:hypothetical protein